MRLKQVDVGGRGETIRRIAAQRGERPVVSYLVRYWLEPEEDANDASPFRGYVRNLETGKERYFGDPRRFAQHVLRRLQSAREDGALGGLDEIEDAVG